MHIRIPGSSQSSPRGGWRPLPVSYDAARLNATDIARGVAQFGESYVRLRKEEEDMRNKALMQEAVNNYDLMSTRVRSSYNDVDRENAGGWEEHYMRISEPYIRDLVEGVPAQYRQDLQMQLLDRQAKARMDVVSRAARAQTARYFDATEAQGDLLLRNGDYGGYVELVDQMGSLTPEQKALAKDKVSAQQLQDMYQRDLSGNPRQAYMDLQGGVYAKLGPEEERKMRAQVEAELAKRAKRRPLSQDEQDAAAAGIPAANAYEVRNGATKDEHWWRFVKEKTGDFKKVSGAIAKAWKEEADNMPYPDDDEKLQEWTEDFVAKWCDPDIGYGCSEKTLRAYVDDKVKALRGKVDTSIRVDHERMVDDMVKDVVRSTGGNAVASWIFGGEALSDPDVQERVNKIKGKVNAYMTDWHKNHPDPTYDQVLKATVDMISHATREVQAEVVEDDEDYAKKLTSSELLKTFERYDYRQHWKNQQTANRAKANQDMMHDQYEAEQKQQAMTPADEEALRASFGSATQDQAGELPPIESEGEVVVGSFQMPGIMVPREEWDALQGEGGVRNPVAYVTTGRGAYTRVRVLGPSRSGGYEIGRRTGADLASFSPGHCQISYHAGSSGFGERIIANEYPPDKPVQISKLRAEDGGGRYEVLGINQKSHPEMFEDLAQMIKDGYADEYVRAAAAQYVEHYTRGVGMAFDAAGVDCYGAEQYVRDMHFNGGAGGGNTILARAIGAEPTGSSYGPLVQRLRAFVDKHGKETLMRRLHEARIDYYKSIARRNPSKRVFLKGWLNRANAMYNEGMEQL